MSVLWSALRWTRTFQPANRTATFRSQRCRELLDEEAIDLTDDEVERVRRCADTVAQILIDMFLDEKRPTSH